MITNNGSSNPDTAVVNFPAGHNWSGPIAGLCISDSKAFVAVGDSTTKALVGVVNGIATDSPSYQDHAIPLFNNSTTLPRLTAIQAVIPSGTAKAVVGTESGLGPPIGYFPEFYEIHKTGGVGDLDEDGDVDTDDLAEMHEDLGLCASDVDQDGDTDVMDLLLVIDYWGVTCP